MRIAPITPAGVKPVKTNVQARQTILFAGQEDKPAAPKMKWTNLAPVVLAGMATMGFLSTVGGVKVTGPQVVAAENKKEESKVVKVTKANFEAEVLNSKVPVVLKFGAPWCGPCRAMQPNLEKLAKEYDGKIKVAEINIDDDPELAEKYDVNGIPDTHLFKKKTSEATQNDTVDHVVGSRSYDQLKEWVKKHVPNLDEKSK